MGIGIGILGKSRQRFWVRLIASGVSVMGILSMANSGAFGEIRPEKVYVADIKKSEAYRKEGLITGGDRTIDDVIIRDIRRAPNSGFERVVIDLDGTRLREPAAVPRPPYYQLSVQPNEKRIVVSLWGRPHLAFDSRKVMAAFSKSQVIEKVQLLPKLEEDLWTFVIELKSAHAVEAFELDHPVRLILDISRKNSGTL